MHITPAEHASRDIHKILIGSIVPRPIAFVSTVSREGIRNLAPFSFFNAVCSEPPVILFSAGYKKDSNGTITRKDTLSNVQETGEFVVNIVSEDFAAAMNATSGEYGPDVDEFAVSGLTAVESDMVRPPRVQEARVQMECRLHQILVVSGKPGGASLVLGEVVRIHVADEIISGYTIDPDRLSAVGRMGGNSYVRTRDRFELERPDARRI